MLILWRGTSEVLCLTIGSFPRLIESCCADTSVINPPSSAHDVPVYLSTSEFVFSSIESAGIGAESCDYTLFRDNTGSVQCIRGLDNDEKKSELFTSPPLSNTQEKLFESDNCIPGRRLGGARVSY